MTSTLSPRIGLILAGFIAAAGLMAGCASPTAAGAGEATGERVYTDWYSPDAVPLPPPPDMK